jgi:pentatricopeptide repeat protein
MPNKAIRLFKQIKDPNEVHVILVFNACAQLGTPEALSLVDTVSSSIPKSFSSNPRIKASLLDASIKCKDLVSAEKLFSTIDRSVISYGNLMSGYNKANRPNKTLELFYQMEKESVVPNQVILLPVIKALSRLGGSSLARSIIDRIPKSILAVQEIQNTLIDMWASALVFHPFTPLFYFLQTGQNGSFQ